MFRLFLSFKEATFFLISFPLIAFQSESRSRFKNVKCHNLKHFYLES